MLGRLVQPFTPKARCLATFLGMKPFRNYSLLHTPGKFLRKNWLPFAWSAPQAAYTLTGYGVVLGGIMAAVTDTAWAIIRSYEGKGVKVIFPKQDDLLNKSIRYLAQPAFHMKAGAALSYQDHWTLLSADLLAATVIMDSYSSDLFLEREETIAATQIPHFEPWEPSTIETLESYGWRRGDEQSTPIAGLPPAPTFMDVSQNLAAGLPAWYKEIQEDFPISFSTSYFGMVFNDLGSMIVDWLAGESNSLKPLFDPEEIWLAKMVEWNTGPAYQPWPEQLEIYLDTLRAMMQAEGLTAPRLAMVRNAVDEAFGTGLPADLFPPTSGLSI
jgi:hypothetical protein